MHFDAVTYQRSLKLKWYLHTDVSARVHMEKKKKSKKSVANPGEGSGTPLIFRPKWGPRGRKKFFGDCPTVISGSGWPGLPLSEGLDPPLEIMTWTTKVHYFIFWQVNYHFQIPFIISPIVCIYELKYRMPWSGTILIQLIIKKGPPMKLLASIKLKLRKK